MLLHENQESMDDDNMDDSARYQYRTANILWSYKKHALNEQYSKLHRKTKNLW